MTVSVFTTAGEPIWVDGPLEAISIAVEDAETLVLDFGSYSSQGLFGARGLTSAKFKAWEALPLQPGLEVAQVDWDGTTAHVDWVMIEEIVADGDRARLELASFVAPGSSGGGVFWNGYHIGNTRSQVSVYNENSGAVLRQFSVAALNSIQVTEAFQFEGEFAGILSRDCQIPTLYANDADSAICSERWVNQFKNLPQE